VTSAQAAPKQFPPAEPLVSIVVPVYNAAPFLRESLDSMLAQTYPRLEVIVLDDGSTDETPAIVASYGDRVRAVRQRETRGIYGNANDGIALASGQLVGVFHGDDVYLPTLVEREVEFLEAHPEVGAVFCKDVFVDAEGREFGRLELPPDVSGGEPLDYARVLNALLTWKNAFLRCPTALVRAEVYRDLGGYNDAEFKNTSDLEMWLRIARSRPLAVLDEHLLLYRRGHGSSSERYHRLRTEPERFFRILDLELARGGSAHATPSALAAFEAHRSVDLLMCAASLYVKGDVPAARRLLRTIRLRSLLGSPRVQRWRLSVLLAGLRVLARLPRIGFVADLFLRRWHAETG
jgi:GT2 family glycosyltransferase